LIGLFFTNTALILFGPLVSEIEQVRFLPVQAPAQWLNFQPLAAVAVRFSCEPGVS
jgi:hypothetical protein